LGRDLAHSLESLTTARLQEIHMKAIYLYTAAQREVSEHSRGARVSEGPPASAPAFRRAPILARLAGAVRKALAHRQPAAPGVDRGFKRA
jgi:hypothetical protein